MTTTPVRMEFKVGTPDFDEDDHPRDRRGRFIETGATVKIWGGGTGTVIANIGGGRIEVQRDADGKRVIVHRNYLTVQARPDGEAPTEVEAEAAAAPPTEASVNAEVDPDLADGGSQVLPDRQDAPDRLVQEITPGESVGDLTVGQYIDGPSAIDGHVVGFTEGGGPIVRTEDGRDWPLLPDAEIAVLDDAEPMPDSWPNDEAPEPVDGEAVAPDPTALPEPIDGQTGGPTPEERQASRDSEREVNRLAGEYLANGGADDRLEADAMAREALGLPPLDEAPAAGMSDQELDAAIQDASGALLAEYEAERDRRAGTAAPASDAPTDEPIEVAPESVEDGSPEDVTSGDTLSDGFVVDTATYDPDEDEYVFTDAEGAERRIAADDGVDYTPAPTPDVTPVAAEPVAADAPYVDEELSIDDVEAIDSADINIDPARQAALVEDMRANGFRGRVIVEDTPQGPLLTDGNGRLAAAREAGIDTIPVRRFANTPEGRSAANRALVDVDAGRGLDGTETGPTRDEVEQQRDQAVPPVDLTEMSDPDLNAAFMDATEAGDDERAAAIRAEYTRRRAPAAEAPTPPAEAPAEPAQAPEVPEAPVTPEQPPAAPETPAPVETPEAPQAESVGPEALAAGDVLSGRLGLTPLVSIRRMPNGSYELTLTRDGSDRPFVQTMRSRDRTDRVVAAPAPVEAAPAADVPAADAPAAPRFARTFVSGDSGQWHRSTVTGPGGTFHVDPATSLRLGAGYAVSEDGVDTTTTGTRVSLVDGATPVVFRTQREARADAAEQAARQRQAESEAVEPVQPVEPEAVEPEVTVPADTGAYSVGQTVEVRVYDYSTPGMPQVWRRGVVQRVTDADDNGLRDVIVSAEDDPERLLPVQRVGPRGGGRNLRAVADGGEGQAEASTTSTPTERFTSNGQEFVAFADGTYTAGGTGINRETYDLARSASRAEAVTPEGAETVSAQRIARGESDLAVGDRVEIDGRQGTVDLVSGGIAVLFDGDERRTIVAGAPAVTVDVRRLPVESVTDEGATAETVATPEIPDYMQTEFDALDNATTDAQRQAALRTLYRYAQNGRAATTRDVVGNEASRALWGAADPAVAESERPAAMSRLADALRADTAAPAYWRALADHLSVEAPGRDADADRSVDETPEMRRLLATFDSPDAARAVLRDEGLGLEERREAGYLLVDANAITQQELDDALNPPRGDLPTTDAPPITGVNEQGVRAAERFIAEYETAFGPGTTANVAGIVPPNLLARRRAFEVQGRTQGFLGELTTGSNEDWYLLATRVRAGAAVDTDTDTTARPDAAFPDATGDPIALDDPSLANTLPGAIDPEQWYRLDWNSDFDDVDAQYAMNPARGQAFRISRVGMSTPTQNAINPGDREFSFYAEDGSEGRIILPGTTRMVPVERPVDARRTETELAERNNARRARGEEPNYDETVETAPYDEPTTEAASETIEVPDDDAIQALSTTDLFDLNDRVWDTFEDDSTATVEGDANAPSDEINRRRLIAQAATLDEIRALDPAEHAARIEFLTAYLARDRYLLIDIERGEDLRDRDNAVTTLTAYRETPPAPAVDNSIYDSAIADLSDGGIVTSETFASLRVWHRARIGAVGSGRFGTGDDDLATALGQTRLLAQHGRDTAESRRQIDVVLRPQIAPLITSGDDRDLMLGVALNGYLNRINPPPPGMTEETLRDAARAHASISIADADARSNSPLARMIPSGSPVPDETWAVIESVTGRSYSPEERGNAINGPARARVVMNRWAVRQGVTPTSDGTPDPGPIATPDDDATRTTRTFQDQSIAEMFAMVEADTSMDERDRIRNLTMLGDGPTAVHRGLIVTRAATGDREWHVYSPDGMMRLPFPQHARTRAEAIALADGVLAITNADGTPFDFVSPGVRDRIRTFNASTDGLTMGRRFAAIRGEVPVQRRRAAEWQPGIERYSDVAAPADASPLDPRYNGNADARRRLARDMFTYADDQTGFYTSWTSSRATSNGTGFVFRGKIRDADGNAVGRVERSVFLNGAGQMEAHHDLLTIDPEFQGQGFADRYYESLYAGYEANNLDIVSIQANIDVGGYAWAQRGFTWATGTMPSSTRRRVSARLDGALIGPLAGASEEDRIRVAQLRNRLDNGEDFTPSEIANALRDITWTEDVRTYQRSTGWTTKQVTMWPGKYAMLSTNWNGIMEVRPAAVEEPDDDQFATYEPTGLDIDSPTTTYAQMTAEQAALEALAPRLDPDYLAGPEGREFHQRLSSLRNYRAYRYETTVQNAHGMFGRMAWGDQASVLEPGDRFTLSYDADDTDADPTEIRTFISRSGNEITYSLADGTVATYTPRGNYATVYNSGPAIPDDLPDNLSPIDPDADMASRRAALLAMFTFDDTNGRSGFRTQVTRMTLTDSDGNIAGQIVDRDGNVVGRFERTIEMRDNGPHVHHDLLSLSQSQQGGGFANAYYEHLYQQYEERGVYDVSINANIDVGGYAWAQRGFDWASPYARQSAQDSVRYGLRDLATNARFNDEQRARILALATRVGREQFTPQQIANALRDITWTEDVAITNPDGTDGVRKVTMWPGKAALLGLHWDGIMVVNAGNVADPARYSTPNTTVDSMSDAGLRDEVESLNPSIDALRSELGASTTGDNPARRIGITRMNNRFAALRAEQRRRYDRETRRALGDDAEQVDVADLRPGDTVVVPWIDARDNTRIETATVVDVEEIGDEDVTISVTLRYDDAEGSIETPLPARRGVYRQTQPDTTVRRVRAGDLAVGDRFMSTDASGADTAVTIVTVNEEGDRILFDVEFPDGSEELFELERGESLELAVDAPVVVEPELPEPSTLDDADLEAERTEVAREITRRRLAGVAGNDPATVRLRERHSRLDGEHARRARDTPVPAMPRVPGEPVARPVLYTYQRRNIVALELDRPSTNADPLVRDAAARIRARQPLSAIENAAMREHLSGLAADTSVGVRRQRMYARLAASFDAAERQASGLPPKAPREGVVRTRPEGVNVGETIALTLPGRGVTTATVTENRRIMGGRLRQVTMTFPDGTSETRLLARTSEVYVLPTPRAPKPVVEDGPEYIDGSQIRVGDTMRIMQGSEYRDVVITRVEHDPAFGASRTDRLQFAYEADFAYPQPINHDRVYTRVARGAASGDQPRGIPAPVDDPKPVEVPFESLNVGDRVRYEQVGTQGSILRIEPGSNGEAVVTLLDDSGQVATFPAFAGDSALLLGRGSDQIGAQVQAFRESVARERQVTAVTDALMRAQRRAYVAISNRAVMGRAERVTAVREAEETTRMGVMSAEDYQINRELVAAVDGIFEGEGAFSRRMDFATRVQEAVFADAQRTYVAALRDNEPLSGESYADMFTRIDEQYVNTPPRQHMREVANTLVRSAIDLRSAESTPGRVGGIPDLATDASVPLHDRMAVYRDALGSETFGQVTYTTQTFGDLDLDALAAGETPTMVSTTETRREVDAPDGGPGQHTMQQLDVLRAAGTEVRDRVREREQQIAPDLAAEYGLIDDNGNPVSFEEARAEYEAQRNAYSLLIDERFDPEARAYRTQNPEARAEWEANLTATRERRDAAQARLRPARQFQAELRRRAAYDVLSQARDLGGVRIPVTTGLSGSPDNDHHQFIESDRAQQIAQAQAFRQAEDVLPTDWVENIRDAAARRGAGPINVVRTTRGYAGSSRAEIAFSSGSENLLSGNEYTSVAVHELSHFAEDAVPGLIEAERAYHWSRTSTGDVGSRVREATVSGPAIGGDSRQHGQADEFPQVYAGVNYHTTMENGGGNFYVGSTEAEAAWELHQIGVQGIFGGDLDYIDEDFEVFMYGSLALVGNPRAPRENHAPIEGLATDPAPPRPREVAPRRTSSRLREVTPTVMLRDPERVGMTLLSDYDADPAMVEWARAQTFYDPADANHINVNRRLSGYGPGVGTVVFTDALDRHVARVAVDYRDNGQIVATIRGFDLDALGDNAPAFYDHMSQMFEQMGVTQIDYTAGMYGRDGSFMAERGFGWSGPRPARNVRQRLISNLYGLSTDTGSFTPEQIAEINRFRDLMRAYDIEGTPWTLSPQQILNMMDSIPVSTNASISIGEYLLDRSGYSARIRTGIRPQPRT